MAAARDRDDGAGARSRGFVPHEATATSAEEMLRRAAEIEVREVHTEGDEVVATVRVTNKSGHKLPTGYPEGRRMWLEVAVVDAGGEIPRGRASSTRRPRRSRGTRSSGRTR